MKKTLKHRSLKLLAGILLGASLSISAITVPAKAAEKPAEIQQAASILSGRGVYQGDASGNLNLDKGLTRAELAAILTRMNDEVTDPSVFEVFCYFQDLPAWAKPYVGYTVSHLLMRGYDSAHFGPNDPVNPSMACTVVLRNTDYWDKEGKDWTYATAGQFAASLGWIDPSTAKASTITRGEMAVLLSRASGWSETSKQEQSASAVPAASQVTPPTTASDTQKAFEITADGQYIVHADHWSREDFSQKANPAVFTSVYTRELYNTIRQTLVDGKAGDQPAFTKASSNDVNRVLSYMSGVLRYDKYAPQNFPNHYEYPNYFAVNTRMPDNYKAPLDFIQPVVEHVKTLTSDREKVTYLNDYLCSLMTYDYENHGFASAEDVFASHTEEVKGVCGGYADNFHFLCQAADIPCIDIVSEEKNHAWNMVYADGEWLHVDVTANDADSGSVLLVKSRPNYPDSYPAVTAFLQELLVPGSTAK